ncbi:hypothetical protein HT667_04455 [Ursidibacter maritimus]|uniref:hypothetical protein n=1 Tax=Ursidibacter maritimus TaxID=1331689 RepID=UPI001C46EA5C|nr:hypothetical protein [Ursidibacter maritimus]MBV6540720.1 hypothetical protein [Ursidibacter maritimus]
MRKYYIVTTKKILEEYKPLVTHCAIFRTEQKAQKLFEYIAKTMPSTQKDILEVQVEELHLVTMLDEKNQETIVGFGDEQKAAEAVKGIYLQFFPTHSFSVRPFQSSDFI